MAALEEEKVFDGFAELWQAQHSDPETIAKEMKNTEGFEEGTNVDMGDKGMVMAKILHANQTGGTMGVRQGKLFCLVAVLIETGEPFVWAVMRLCFPSCGSCFTSWFAR